MQHVDAAPPPGRGAKRSVAPERARAQAPTLWRSLAAASRRDRAPPPPPETTPDEDRRTLDLALDAAGNIATFAIAVARDCWVGDGRLAAMYGLPVEQVRAGVATARLLERVHPDDRPRVAERHARVLAGGAEHGDEYCDEYRIVVAGGPERWLGVRGLRTRERERRAGPARIVGIVTDTTAHKQHAQRLEALVQERTEALRDALRSQHLLIEHHPDVLWILRVEAASAGRAQRFVFEVFNSGTHNLTGLDVAQLLGRTPHECFPPAMAEAILAHYRACARSGVPMTYNESHELPIGLRHYETRLVPIRAADGRVERIIGSARDITDRLALEGRLRQAQRMEAIGRLCAGVAHDFNNILQSISGALDLLRDEVVEPFAGDEFVDIAAKACRRGGQLTHHLLAYTCQQVLQPRVLDVADLLARLASTLRRTIGPHIQIVLDTPRERLAVHVDAAMFETALINLAVNAAHAMPHGGRLRLHLRARRSAAAQSIPAGPYGVLSVEDTGSGIPPELLARVFEPFFTTKGTDGTGLGLAMVQGFARQSGGDVAIASAVGRGTTVEVWLPLARAPGVARGPDGAEPPSARLAGRALVVDDDADVLATTAAFLERAGLGVATAAHADAALARLADGEPCDVLVTDFAMPGPNGLDLLGRARQLRPGLPAIIITGHAHGLAGPGAEGVVVLCKPFRREQLVAIVQSLLESSAAAQAERP